MPKIYDTIIWGASLNGLEKAVRLQKAGRDVLILNKFGFPGGNFTEALSCLSDSSEFADPPFRQDFKKRVEALNFGVLYEQNQQVLMHPEALKRVGWDIIKDNGLQVIFHLTPLKIQEDDEKVDFTVFGREGAFTFSTRELLDMSDNRFLSAFRDQPDRYNNQIRINCFFKDLTPEMEDYFGFETVLETRAGHFTRFVQSGVAWDDIEQQFNRALDELALGAWKKFGVRMLIMPVYPELALKSH
mgnify:CR=1 FL=1